MGRLILRKLVKVCRIWTKITQIMVILTIFRDFRGQNNAYPTVQKKAKMSCHLPYDFSFGEFLFLRNQSNIAQTLTRVAPFASLVLLRPIRQYCHPPVGPVFSMVTILDLSPFLERIR